MAQLFRDDGAVLDDADGDGVFETIWIPGSYTETPIDLVGFIVMETVADLGEYRFVLAGEDSLSSVFVDFGYQMTRTSDTTLLANTWFEGGERVYDLSNGNIVLVHQDPSTEGIARNAGQEPDTWFIGTGYDAVDNDDDGNYDTFVISPNQTLQDTDLDGVADQRDTGISFIGFDQDGDGSIELLFIYHARSEELQADGTWRDVFEPSADDYSIDPDYIRSVFEAYGPF